MADLTMASARRFLDVGDQARALLQRSCQECRGLDLSGTVIVGRIDSATGMVTFGAASDPQLVPEEFVIVFGNRPSDVWSGPAELFDASLGTDGTKGDSHEHH